MKSFVLKTISVILALIAACFLPVAGQSRNGSKETTKKKTYKPGSAWTLATPLGLHESSTIDTLLYNYQRQFIPALTSDAYATTGQLSGPGLDMIYMNRRGPSRFFFNTPVDRWIPSFDKEKFYNVYIPMTLLSYNFSTGRDSHSDLLKAVFAGNVNRRIGVGAFIEYPYTKGSYAELATKELSFGFQAYYTGDHYQMQAFYNHYNHVNKENGGITDDRYITNPAEVQGGVTSIESLNIPVRLSGVQNRLRGQEFYMSHSYAVGFRREITQDTDTVPRFELVPVMKFTYSLDVNQNDRQFLSRDPAAASEFWEHTYFDPTGSDQQTRHWSVANTLGIQMIEGFQKWFPFGLSAWATYDIDRYWFRFTLPETDPAEPETPGTDEPADDGLTPLPEGVDVSPRQTRHRLWLGARIEKTRGKTIRYFAQGKFGLSGDAAGDIDVRGNITTRFRLGRDTVELSAYGSFKNQEPDWILKNYAGNHFIWKNDFGKTRSFRVGGHLYIPWTRSDISVAFENIQNMVYFNGSSMPVQHGGSVQIFSASLDQKLRFGIWNWNNRITYQTSSNQSVLPLPKLAIYSNMFLNFRLFKVLNVQVGVDCDYYTLYPGMLWQPATMSFHVQGDNAVKVGNYPLCNVYLTCKLYKARFFVMCSHVNEGLFGNKYFSMPGYPIYPRQLRLGVSVDFAN